MPIEFCLYGNIREHLIKNWLIKSNIDTCMMFIKFALYCFNLARITTKYLDAINLNETTCNWYGM